MSLQLRSDRALRGTKRRCVSCETPFYDLARDPIHCPHCNELHTPEAPIVFPTPGTTWTKPSWKRKAAPVAPVPHFEDHAADEAPKEELAASADAEATPESTDGESDTDETPMLETEGDGDDISELLDIDEPGKAE